MNYLKIENNPLCMGKIMAFIFLFNLFFFLLFLALVGNSVFVICIPDIFKQ